jgi:hypothetical protein
MLKCLGSMQRPKGKVFKKAIGSDDSLRNITRNITGRNRNLVAPLD